MEENTIKPQSTPVPDQNGGNDDPDDSPHSPQVFDITADLNISPVDENESPDTDPTVPISGDVLVSSLVNQQTVQETPSPIPPQEFPPTYTAAPNQNPASPTARTGPANPPTKTVLSAETTASKLSAEIEKLTGDPIVAPPKQPTTPLDSPEIKPIRTYESDVADLMSHTHVSTASIAIAETKKQTGEEKMATHERREPYIQSHTVKNLLLTLVSLLLLGGGAFGAYYLYLQSPIAPVKQTAPLAVNQPTTSALVTADISSILPIDGLNAKTIISRVQDEISKPQAANTVKEIVPVVTQNNIKVRVSASTMLSIMGIPAPDILSRSLKDSWMLGVYMDSRGQRNVFVVTQNNFFQNSFAGMLQWENRMPDDLKPYLPVLPTSPNAAVLPTPSPIAVPTAATTSSKAHTSAKIATSTIATAFSTFTATPVPSVTLRGQFINKIVDNKDVREYKNADGQVSFLYSFVNSGTLVITGNESSLSEILTRLENQSYMR